MKNQTYQPTEFSDGYDGVGNAEAIVQHMHELQNSGVHAAAPDTVTYNTFIGEFKRVSNKVNKYDPLKAENLLRDMIHLRNIGSPIIAPDQRSYNHLISAWVKTKQPKSSEKSYWWLHSMREEYNGTGHDRTRPNFNTYNKVMAALAQLGHAVKVEH